MNRIVKSIITIAASGLLLLGMGSCDNFFNPDQELNINKEQLFDDWYEYRAAAMGLYALQQQLVEQIVVLGELRGDLLTITPNADPDLVEIYNFNISKNNKYASPANFFKLIAATNRFLSILETTKPDVLDPTKAVNNYDRVYGEALCMRAWAYFNAARIYGKIPYIHQSLSTIEEIDGYINSPETYIDSIYIKYSIDGFNNDTIRNQPESLDKKYFDLERVILHFTKELETKVKAVGVNHYIDNDDNSWEVTVWSTWSYNTLLGQMYLTLGDYTKSMEYFSKVTSDNLNHRYQLDKTFANEHWMEIFMSINNNEHIYTLWFNKAAQQQNNLQRLFEPFPPNEYMLRPTKQSIHLWETVWRGMNIRYDSQRPDSTKTLNPGTPGDLFRGYGISYAYSKNNVIMSTDEVNAMLRYKMLGEDRSVESAMENVDTLVYKYSIGKNLYDQDANFIVYRAASVNLYMAEIINYWTYIEKGVVTSFTRNALNIINNGYYYDEKTTRVQLGVRGRVGLGGSVEGLKIQDINYVFDPFTNQFVGWYDLSGNLRSKQYQLENQIMDERARELAYEGERFYDLMRVAKRRNDPSYLAQKVAEKYPWDKKDAIYNHLMNEKNWYINYFE
jgi:starch-binding outer membrane protein, SusD/RagB family